MSDPTEGEGDGGSRRDAEAARVLLLGFLAALGDARAEVSASVPSVERLADLPALVRSGLIARRGEAGGHTYLVHEAGCRLTSPSGIDVDVDFTADGAEIFDFWRLRTHGRSLPTPVDPSEKDLRAAVDGLTDLLAEVRPGWFNATGSRRGADEDPRRDERRP
ncbi:hypothetical protein [Streptomyces sp. M41(2017)]|uniref:DUF6896 domain-containing protein n=1 Tax=Streptomyces sp. M41(2017) TaxID=1955065 RepID=UPI001F4E9C3B|nr:hypothetical protein [Streptomyces sp. M41(2017)]